MSDLFTLQPCTGFYLCVRFFWLLNGNQSAKDVSILRILRGDCFHIIYPVLLRCCGSHCHPYFVHQRHKGVEKYTPDVLITFDGFDAPHFLAAGPT
jgi:hypothetical protein